MARIAHLFDHTCVIWHQTETLGASRETIKSFPTYTGPLGCKVNRKNAVLQEAGPGIADSGERRIYLEKGPSVKKRDLVELVTGPDAHALLEVESATVPSHSLGLEGHHLEIRATEYLGAEPELGS